MWILMLLRIKVWSTEVPFYESMPTHPEVVLSDLIKIFHPQLLPEDYEPVFYRLLR